MQESPLDLETGRHVRVRGRRWVVLDTQRFDRVRLIRLRGDSDGNRGELCSVLTPFDIVEAAPLTTRLRQQSRRRVLATVAAAIADAAPWEHCWTAATAGIELRAWQLEPALAAVAGATRLLLADHVGLGKTIQASLIVSELRARGLADRVLVLTPASLREQWAEEMRTRFGLSPTIFDHAALNHFIAALPLGVNPWQTAPLIIASIDLVKRGEVRSAIDGVGFDVLIVDEAHHVAPGTDRGHLVADIASRTPWVVLATATPHGGDDDAFQFLRRIGAGRSDGLVTFRRNAMRLAGRAPRRSRLLAVAPTEAERALLDAVTQYARHIGRARAALPGVVLVASVIARRAASSAEAARRTLSRRLALLAREAIPVEQQPGLPWDEHDPTDAGVPDNLLATAGPGNVADEIETLKRLILLAEAATARWSKARVLCRLLARTREQVLVFSEFRDVALLAADALRHTTSIATLHGGLSARERCDLVRAFNDGRIRTLVATDAAGEGLNLQSRCRLVVNLELPWTPRRLEQRIGRVDRLGQTRRVHALHLIHRGSFEGTVIARLERRRFHAQARTPELPTAESPTAAAVERRLRVIATRGRAVDSIAAVYAPRGTARAHVRTALPRVVLVFGATLVDRDGRLVQRELVPLIGELPGHLGGTLSRRVVRHLAIDPAVERAVSRELERRLIATQRRTRAFTEAVEQRLLSCLHSLDRREGQIRWQGSLFDRRAEQQAGLCHAHILQLRDWLEHKRARAMASAALRHTPPRLRAAWLEQ